MANTNLSRDRKTAIGPPKPADMTQRKAAIRQTSRGQRVEPKGAGAGQGPTPDARIRQRVLNKGQDSRRNGDGGASRLDKAEATGVAGPPVRPRAIGSPPGEAAPPRKDSRWTDEQRANWQAKQAQIQQSGQAMPGDVDPGGQPAQQPGQPQVAGPPKIGEERRAQPVAAQVAPGVPGTPQGPPSSADVAAQSAAPGQSQMDPAQQDQVRATAGAEAAQGQMPEPPGQVDAQGNFQPEPGMAPQAAAEAIQAQTEGMMQQKPEPALAKSPLGAESPIEQADAGGKLRAGMRHHIRQLGFQTSGMDPKTAKEFERKAVRDFDQFGEYPGMDDPHAPAPPIRVGKHSFNPMTGAYVMPEGQISVLDRLAPTGAKGPDTVLTADAVRKGEV